jgi:hypothetical protein
MKTKALYIFIGIFLSCTLFIPAKDYKAVVSQLPTSETFINLIKTIGEVTGNNIEAQIVPHGRAIYQIENKQVDIYCPATVITNSKKISALNFDYATVKFYKMAFVLYTNKKKPVDIADLKKGIPKNLKSNQAHL